MSNREYPQAGFRESLPADIRKNNSLTLAFNAGGCNTFNIILLHKDEHNDHRDCRNYQRGHNRAVVDRAGAEEGLNRQLDGTFILSGHDEERPHKVIPVSDKIQNKYGRIDCLGNWHYNLEEGANRVASVNRRCLQKVIGNIAEEILEHVQREAFCNERHYQRLQSIDPA